MRSSLYAAASLAALLTIGAAPATAAMAIHLTDAYDHPGAKVGVNGSGFGAYATIDIYFDTTDELIVTANSNGAFSKHIIPVPTDALPGEHWISAAERDDGQGAQKPFTVSTDWTELGFDARNRRNNRWENVISTGNVATLDTMWSRKTGNSIQSSPAVVNGIAYVGSFDDSLYALDAGTGAILWSFVTGGPVVSSPAVAAGIVYVGSEDGMLYAVDAATGASKWSTATGDQINSSPAVANGIVYVGSDDHKLYAFDAPTGAVLWTATTDSKIASSPAVFDGVVYTGSTDGTISAYDAVDGTRLWGTVSGSNANISTPTVSGGSVWVTSSTPGSHYTLYRLRAADGVTLAVVDLGGSGSIGAEASPAPAVANGIVYVSIGGPNQLIALQPEGETITTLWTYNFGVTLDVPTAPAVANGIVYVGSGFDGDLFALDPATGDTLWSGVTQGLDNLSSPAVSNGVVFFGGDRRLFAFALNGGNNAVYKRKHTRPPSFESLHPDFNLKPSR